MTGFAAKTLVITGKHNETTHVSISIKSVNSRFFDATFKVHYTLSSLEHPIVGLAKEILQRGHMYCTIHISNPNIFVNSIQPSLSMVQSYLEAIESIKKVAHIQQPILLEHILRLPNIFSAAEPSVNQEGINTIFNCVKDLLYQVQTMREQEGMALQKDLEDRIERMRFGIQEIASCSVLVMENQKQKIGEVCSINLILMKKLSDSKVILKV
jgi:uncharacterized protein (TIGR00255 family)